MAANPQPAHITAEMWWFVEELERLDPVDTVFAGAWGNFKPGYHCDYRTLLATPAWRNDYSVHLLEDKVGGTSLENYGAAVDWTSLSAQAGNFTRFKKYGARIKAAFVIRDPRLKGWREVLCQGDNDPLADGYDFVYWTERTPDATHTWHMHFSCLRKYLRNISVYRAMISILRGETLNQWFAQSGQGGDDDMARVFWFGEGYWVAVGGKRELIRDADDMSKVLSVHPGSQYPGVDAGKVFPAPKLDTIGWTEDEVDRLIGRKYTPSSGGGGGTGGGGASPDEVRVIVHEELGKLKLTN